MQEKTYTIEEKIKIVTEAANYIVNNKSSLYKTTKVLNIPKTNLARWINDFLPKVDLDLFLQAKKILSFNRRDKINSNHRLLNYYKTYRLALLVLNSDKDFVHTLKDCDVQISRTQAYRLLYDDLYELDPTENKDLYIKVMKKLSLSCDSGNKYKISKQKLKEIKRK